MLTVIEKAQELQSYKRSTSILTPAVGIATQVACWFPLFLFGVEFHKNEVAIGIASIFAFIWFFIPLASIYGIYAGVRYLAKNGFDYLAILGVIFNLIWFTLLVLASYLVFVIGIHV